MKKERWFNYRPLCLVFVSLLLGSVFAFYLFFARGEGHTNLEIILSIVGAVLFVGLFLFFAIRNKNYLFIVIPVLAFIVGGGAFSLAVVTFPDKNFTSPSTISARIALVELDEDEFSCKLTIDNLVFDGIKKSGSAKLYLTDYTNQFDGLNVGTKISVKPTKTVSSDLFYYETPSASYYTKDIKYTVFANIKTLTFGETKLTLAERIKARVKRALSFGLSNENAELAYSALFGEKVTLYEAHQDAFKLSGVSHLLAVSGLHISIIAGILNFIFKKLKFNDWVRLTLVGAALIFYTYLCDFSTSVIRATIMSIMLILAPMLKRQYDSLSAIGCAGIICFMINPLLAFDVGGIMSFSCALGICLLNRSINHYLRLTKMPKAIRQSLSLTLSTLTSLMFIMAFYYNTLNLVSLIANLVIIPIFTIGFACSLIIGFLGLIAPQIGVLLVPINYLFNFITMFAAMLGQLPFANMSTLHLHYISIWVYFVFLMFMSRFCVKKPEHKLVAMLPAVAILMALMV